MRYRHAPSSLTQVTSDSSSLFFTKQGRNPLAEYACQPVFSTISASAVPAFPRGVATTTCCLVASQGVLVRSPCPSVDLGP